MAEYVYGFVPFEEIPEFKMVRREEVVRCRDCKRFSVDNSDHDYRSGWWCKRWNTDMVKPDGFCAWGERNGVVNEQTSTKLEPTMTELKPCPFCKSRALYEGYHKLDGFVVPVMFCNQCKALVTFEGYEDYVTNENDGMTELRAAWNRRADA